MLENIIFASSDPILGLSESFNADSRKKINLGIGVYRDELGKTPIFFFRQKSRKISVRERSD